jgi:hypothetical protein
MAIQTALNRARFNMNCPSATGTVLSTNVTQPALQGPLVYGTQRMEYKVGVTGCGQRRTYIVICPEGGTGCSATPGRR